MLARHALKTATMKMVAAAIQRVQTPFCGGVSPGRDLWSEKYRTSGMTGFETLPLEGLDCPSLNLSGRWPEGTYGSLYRNGPAMHENMGLRYHHWFDGDGMVHRFHIAPNKEGVVNVSHRARYVMTHKLKTELNKGKRFYPTFGTWSEGMLVAMTEPDSANTANINVLKHADRLMALWEGGSAIELNEETLETISPIQWSRLSRGLPFGAHPLMDDEGRLWNIGAAPWFSSLFCYQIEANGRLKRLACHVLERMGMIHAFCQTANYLVVLLSPFEMKGRPRTSYLEAHRWRPGEATRILVIEKNDLNSIKTIAEIPAGWVFHYANGFEDKSGNIHVDAFWYEDVSVMTSTTADVMKGINNLGAALPRLSRLRINLQNGKADITKSDYKGEFPATDPGWELKNNPVGYSLVRGKGGGLSAVGKYKNGEEVEKYDYGEGVACEEHVYIKHPQKKGGWLMGTSYAPRSGVTSLAALDAENLSAGPIAEASLPYAVPLGLHGSFVPLAARP